MSVAPTRSSYQGLCQMVLRDGHSGKFERQRQGLSNVNVEGLGRTATLKQNHKKVTD